MMKSGLCGDLVEYAGRDESAFEGIQNRKIIIL
jgi:hypothetical protein